MRYGLLMSCPSSSPAKAGDPVHTALSIVRRHTPLSRGMTIASAVNRAILRPPWLDASRRSSGERIVRPGMTRVPPAHLATHRRVGAAPEARKIACHLHGAMRGREQLDDQRDAPAHR